MEPRRAFVEIEAGAKNCECWVTTAGEIAICVLLPLQPPKHPVQLTG
jgi:hypothetical protein